MSIKRSAGVNGAAGRTGSTILTHASLLRRAVTASAIAACLGCPPAFAQEGESSSVRTRVGIGPQLYPSYPGSDEFDVGPYIEFERARGDDPFGFEAPDESFGFSLFEAGGFSAGPVINWEGARTAEDVGADLPKVKFSLEPGGFVSLNMTENFRLRGEVRKGVTGHKGWVGTAGADFVMRDGDAWLFSVGPRVTWANNRYQDAWFGVSTADSVIAGVPAYDPNGGIQAYGATASFLTQFNERVGVATYAKYDRLVGDAADSPIVTEFGSRDQFSGGLALTYTFGGN